MGALLTAKCELCGFSANAVLGGGMMNFTKVCHVPAIDKRTGSFVIKNLFDKKNNKHYTFYNEAAMYSGIIDSTDLRWLDVQLKSTNNYCPQCKAFSMRFIRVGCFD